MRYKSTVKTTLRSVIYFDISEVIPGKQLSCKRIAPEKYPNLKGHLYLEFKNGNKLFMRLGTNYFIRYRPENIDRIHIFQEKVLFIGGYTASQSISELDNLLRAEKLNEYLICFKNISG